MKCQKCRSRDSGGKFTVKNAGQAIQMVPDYNPVDDISWNRRIGG